MKKLILFVLVLATSAFSQGPVKELTLELSGKPAVFVPNLQGSALDVNGDGVRDLAITSPRDVASGQATGIVIKSGNSNQTWVYPLESFSLNFEEIKQTFLGFYEMNNASPEKEAIFAEGMDGHLLIR